VEPAERGMVTGYIWGRGRNCLDMFHRGQDGDQIGGYRSNWSKQLHLSPDPFLEGVKRPAGGSDTNLTLFGVSDSCQIG